MKSTVILGGARRRRSRAWTCTAVIAATLVASSACGVSGGRDFTVGFKRVALDLSYKDDALAVVPTRQDIVTPQPVPALAEVIARVPIPRDLSAPLPAPPADIPSVQCPVAGSDQFPDAPATVFVTTPPAAGTYTTHNKGTISIDGPTPFKLPFPPEGVIQIRNVKETITDDVVQGPKYQVIMYDLFVPGLSGGGTTRTYRISYSPATLVSTTSQTASRPGGPEGDLTLVRLVSDTPAGHVDFRPQPPVTIVSFKNGEGTSWQSGGVDPNDQTSMVVQGSITRRKNIDLCGHLYDTYEVASNEHIVNVRTGLRSDTSSTDPNLYHLATNMGGLFIDQHINETASFPSASGALTSITTTYDQTFDSIKPSAR
jgi:hypothetical protein